MSKKPRLRTVKFWANYDPARKQLAAISPYKYNVPKPSRESGFVTIEFKGFYVPKSSPKRGTGGAS